MSFASLAIRRATDGRQIVGRPLATDVIGYALRDAFDDTPAVPSHMQQLLERLSAVPHHPR